MVFFLTKNTKNHDLFLFFFQEATKEIPTPHSHYDYVSRPNPHSNIRRVVYSKATSPEEEILNVERTLTNDWNDSFWKDHNNNFFQVI